MNDPSKHIPTSSSSAEEWVVWHKALKRWFSKNEANQYWVNFWNQRAGAGSDADVNSLRAYMKSQDVKLVTDTSGDITDTVVKATDWFASGIDTTRTLLFGGVILGMGLIAYYVIAQTRQGKTASDMALDVASLRAGRMKGVTSKAATTKLLQQ